jgi:hypothetical protein
MKLNWKLLIFDFLVVVWLILVISTWNDTDDFRMFREIVMGICLLIWRIDAHYNFYQKERRLY